MRAHSSGAGRAHRPPDVIPAEVSSALSGGPLPQRLVPSSSSRLTSSAASATSWWTGSPSSPELSAPPAHPAAKPGARFAPCSAGARCRAGGARRASSPRPRRLLFEHSPSTAIPASSATSPPPPRRSACWPTCSPRVNPNVGGWELRRWRPRSKRRPCAGWPSWWAIPGLRRLLVSGGNMANFVCFSGRARAMLGEDVRARGARRAGARLGSTPPPRPTPGSRRRATSSASAPRHPLDPERRTQRLAPDALDADRGRPGAGDRPILVVGTAGSVGSGRSIRSASSPAICREHGLWSTWTAPTARRPPCCPTRLRPAALRAGRLARGRPAQVALAPLEAGCVLVREPRVWRGLRLTPAYYRFETEGEEPPINYHELGCRTAAASAPSRSGSGCARPARGIRADDRRRMPAGRGAPRAGRPRTPSSRPSRWASASRPSATYRSDLRGAPGARPTVSRQPQRDAAGPAQAGRRGVRHQRACSTGASCSRCIVNFRTTEADVAAIPGIVARADARRRRASSRGGTIRTDVVHAGGAAARLLECLHDVRLISWHLRNAWPTALVRRRHRRLGYRAVCEYLLQVPANRIGYTMLWLAQLEVLEAITLTVCWCRSRCKQWPCCGASASLRLVIGHGFIPQPIHAGGLRYSGAAPIISHLLIVGQIEAVAFAEPGVEGCYCHLRGARGWCPRRSRLTLSGRRLTRL